MKILIELYPTFEHCDCSQKELLNDMVKQIHNSLTYHQRDHIHNIEVLE